MKTSKSISQKNSVSIQKSEGILLTVSFLFILLLSSCKKESTLSPIGSQVAGNEFSDRSILQHAFEMIKINHDANSTFTPDYSVSVRSDGLVTYEGRSRVKVAGKIQFDISAELVKKLDAIFAPPSFINSQITSGERNECHDCQLHPIITTTYFNGSEPPKIWIDDGSGFPVDVVYRRQKVEELLGIAKYVEADVVVARDVKAEL